MILTIYWLLCMFAVYKMITRNDDHDIYSIIQDPLAIGAIILSGIIVPLFVGIDFYRKYYK